MKHLEKLISVFKETRIYLARKENDFFWGSWKDQEEALSEIDAILIQLENGSIPDDIELLFGPTGPIQEVSMSSGWSRDFLLLAERFDEAFAIAKRVS